MTKNLLKIKMIIGVALMILLPVLAWPIPKAKKHESSYSISVDSALREFRKGKSMFVDLRNKKDFQKLRIPSSLNIPLYAIKTKAFLKKEKIIIVNNGFLIVPLETPCAKLRKLGFMVSILSGGLNAWHAKNGPLDGDLFAIEEIRYVKPQDVYLEKEYENVTIIDVSRKQDNELADLIPSMIHMPELRDTPQVINHNKNKPFFAVLIMNQDGERYDRIDTKGISPVFYLEGGINGYNRFIGHLALLRQPDENKVKQTSTCGKCNKRGITKNGRKR